MRLLHQLRDHFPDRKLVLYAFSRGARWINELAKDYSDLFDATVASAPYPPVFDAPQHVWLARQVCRLALKSFCAGFSVLETSFETA